jgi:hypothetical protein
MDQAPAVCAECGKSIPAGETAVAVRRAQGAPDFVHPGCLPRYTARPREEREARRGSSGGERPAAPGSP